ncbi:MAG: phosphoribosylamine--glycine ligase [Halobacteriovoraceae bacterium]|nr:phosphoribosylamine--glycine ligase [Halobacteriovoraceae bacterium]
MNTLRTILVIGSGGREQAIAFKLAESQEVGSVYICPDPMTPFASEKIRGLNLNPNHFDELSQFTIQKNIDLVVVGPEVPLVNGVVDFLENKGVPVLGPSKNGAKLEGSKHFSKQLMKDFKIPTAAFKNASSYEEGVQYLNEIDKMDTNLGIVIKADKLAAGKGVFLCDSKNEAEDLLYKIMKDDSFVIKDDKVVIEEKLFGKEISAFALCDGESFLTLGYARDYKRLEDYDKGPNTGGMGGFSHEGLVDDELREKIDEKVFSNTLKSLKKLGVHYKGILFAGLMIGPDGGINVLEFNVRMGDPEAQILLPLVKEDLYPLFKAAADGELADLIKKRPLPLRSKVHMKEGSSVHVVMVSEGYPLLEKGKKMKLDQFVKMPQLDQGPDSLTHYFLSGVKKEKQGKRLLNKSGRVLGVTGLGISLKEARDRAYEEVHLTHFDGAHFRTDIALNL